MHGCGMITSLQNVHAKLLYTFTQRLSYCPPSHLHVIYACECLDLGKDVIAVSVQAHQVILKRSSWSSHQLICGWCHVLHRLL